MVGVFRMEKLKMYPRPHNWLGTFGLGLEPAIVNSYTIIPFSFYDEGIGAASSYTANPENAAFAEAPEMNNFVDSRIDKIFAQIEFSLTKAALETDKVHAVKVCYMPIFTSFDDYTAIDEKSTNEIQDVLELQTESTDNQGFPLYNTVDMKAIGTLSTLLPTNQPGLT